MIEIEELRRRFIYNAETGDIFWRERNRSEFSSDLAYRSHMRFSGKAAGSLSKTKCGMFYRQVNFDLKRLLLHRVAWAIFHGEHPEKIDHINGDTLDNRICNLRNVSHSENSKNQGIGLANTSGYVGVYENKQGVMYPWRAAIKVDQKYIHLGNHKTAEDAYKARKEAEKFYGFSSLHGERERSADIVVNMQQKLKN